LGTFHAPKLPLHNTAVPCPPFFSESMNRSMFPLADVVGRVLRAKFTIQQFRDTLNGA
jgi:hypothetical protein